jgi:hypothetical protein
MPHCPHCRPVWRDYGSGWGRTACWSRPPATGAAAREPPPGHRLGRRGTSAVVRTGPHRPAADRALRGPGLRVRCPPEGGAAGAAGMGRRHAGGPAGGRCRRPAPALQRRLLERGARPVRPRAARREAAGRLADIERGPTAVERHRGRGACGVDPRSPDGARHGQRLGHQDHVGLRRRLQPHRVPRRHGLAYDTGIITEGFRRYGFREQASVLALAIIEAAGFFSHRLPEVFAGFAREETTFPVEYPTASRPQAWSAGAPLLAMRTLLGLDPGEAGLRVSPHLPEAIAGLRLRGLRFRGTRGRAVTNGSV